MKHNDNGFFFSIHRSVDISVALQIESVITVVENKSVFF